MDIDDTTDQSIQSRSSEKHCVFCMKLLKRLKGRVHRLSHTNDYESMDNVKFYATKWNDVELLNRIQAYIDSNESINYHKVCKTHYNSTNKTKDNKKGVWHETRNHYKVALQKLCLFIKTQIIEKKECYFLNFLLLIFQEFSVDSYNPIIISKQSLSTRHIPEKIKSIFKKEIKIISTPNHKKIVSPQGLNVDIKFEELSDKDIILRSALILRNAILNVGTFPLTKNANATDIIRGECTIPAMLNYFFTTTISAFNYKQRKSARTKRLVESFSSDLINSVTFGKINPSKNITLGIAVKNLTSSKKIVNLLHRYGHICSYDTLRCLETEVTYKIAETNDLCGNLRESKDLSTCVAFDNFDRFIETGNAKIIMNDTVGIVIQDEISRDGVESENLAEQSFF